MREYNIKKHNIKIIDSSTELPIRSYQKFNKHLMIASQIGESIQDYDNGQARVIQFLRNKMYDDAIKETQNNRQCFFNAIQEYSPSNMAIAYLVHSIDGTVYTKRDDATLNRIIDHLDSVGFTKQMTLDTLDTVKKKSKTSLDYISLVTFLILICSTMWLIWMFLKLIWMFLGG